MNSSAGGILTVMISVNRFAELAESGICKIIDVGRKMTAMMDNVRGSLGILPPAEVPLNRVRNE